MHYSSSSRFTVGFRVVNCHIHLSRATPDDSALRPRCGLGCGTSRSGYTLPPQPCWRLMMGDGALPIADWACLAGPTPILANRHRRRRWSTCRLCEAT